MRIHVHPDRPAPRQLLPAIESLRRDGVIIYPTDTGYAFGCALSSPKGVARIRKLKGYPEKHPKPLTMIVGDVADLGRYGQLGNRVFRIVRRVLPGPYTIVLSATKDTPRAMKNRDHEVGMRLPDHAVCRMLVQELGEPLLTGSCTPAEGEIALEDPEELERLHGPNVDVVIDAGMIWPEPSTVLRLVDDQLEVLRAGQGPIPE
jgi:tRNA threonylcarbamoyl adenosine modification protein (Sua5/YciO/YrdC/YwlC family)